MVSKDVPQAIRKAAQLLQVSYKTLLGRLPEFDLNPGRHSAESDKCEYPVHIWSG